MHRFSTCEEHKKGNFRLQYKINYNIYRLLLNFADMCVKKLLHLLKVETKSRIRGTDFKDKATYSMEERDVPWPSSCHFNDCNVVYQERPAMAHFPESHVC